MIAARTHREPTSAALAPGAYLAKRREAAGLTIGEVARQLAAMQLGIVRLDRANLLAELGRIEAGEAALTLPQAEVLQNIFRFDVGIYDQLLDRWLADEQERRSMPLPQICRGCACSYFDPCLPDPSKGEQGGACHWASVDLCSACANKPAMMVVEAVTVSPAHEGAC